MRALFAAAAAAALGTAPLAVRADVPAGPALDLRAAVRYALAHDPAVLADAAAAADAQARYARNHAAEFPQIAGQLQNSLFKTNGYASGTFGQIGLAPAQNYSQNTAQITGSWQLYNGSSTQLYAQAARRDAEAARGTLLRAQQQLAADVAAAFWNLSARREAVALAQGDLGYQRRLTSDAQAQERVGRVAGVDVLRARAGALRSQAAYNNAAAAEDDAREALAQRIGAPATTAFAVPATLPEPAAPAAGDEAFVAAASAGRADIAAARARVASARLADAQIESDRRPQLALSGAFGNQLSPTGLVQAQRQIDLQNAARGAAGLAPLAPVTRGNPGFWQLGATETFTLPFIEYGSRSAQHAAARAHVDAALAQLAATENAVGTDVRTAARAVRTDAANVALYREAAAAGTESARVAELQYRAGLVTLTDAAQAQQTALASQGDLVTARVNLLAALARLRAAVGTADPVAVATEGIPG